VNRAPIRHQRGAIAVEFAGGALLLCIGLFGAVEVARLFWTLNAAADATRVGARLAAVCTPDDAAIKQRMQQRLPALADSDITVEYLNPGSVSGNCNVNNCRLVRVSLQAHHRLLVPVPAAMSDIALPSFKTTVPREVMNSSNQSPACS
jgi:Flp pilus assembly protein TadG